MSPPNVEQLTLDAIDRQLLVALQQDGKRSVKALAAELGLTKTPVYERIRRLEEAGVIQRYVALVDKQKMPPKMTAFCSVSLLNQASPHVDAFVEAVQHLPEVLDCYVIGGDFDLLLKVVCQDLQSYYGFVIGTIAALPNVANTKSFFVINEAKSSTSWPVE